MDSTGRLNNTALHSAAENAEVNFFLPFTTDDVQVEVMRELIGNGLSLSSKNSRLAALQMSSTKLLCFLFFHKNLSALIFFHKKPLICAFVFPQKPLCFCRGESPVHLAAGAPGSHGDIRHKKCDHVMIII